MDLLTQTYIEGIAFDLFIESRECKKRGDWFRYYRKLALARGVHIHFENQDIIRMFDRYFEYAIKDGELDEQEVRDFKNNGVEKAQFLANIIGETKEFIQKYLGTESKKPRILEGLFSEN